VGEWGSGEVGRDEEMGRDGEMRRWGDGVY